MVVLSPVLSTLLLIKHIARASVQAIVLIIAFSIIIGFVYFFLNILVAGLVLYSMVIPKIKIALLWLLGILILQLLLLYHYNLSFIDRGTGITCLCYLFVFACSVWYYNRRLLKGQSVLNH